MSIWVEIRHPKNWIRCTSGLCFPVSTRISEYWSRSDYMGLTGEKNSKVQSVMEGIHPHFHIWTIFYPHNPPISNIHHSQRIHPNIHPNIVPIYQEAARKQIVCFSRVDKSCFNSVCSCRRLRAPLVAGSRIWEWWVIYWAVLNLKQQGTYGPRSII
jgi:hypothetical protein